MNQKQINKLIQKAMNKKGESLIVDGDYGPKTEAAASKYFFEVEALKDDMTPVFPITPPYDITSGLTDPIFKTVKGVKYKDRGNYNTDSGMFSGLTVHYTVSGNAPTGVVNWLAGEGFGCMVMDYDGVIYIPEDFDVLKSWGYHSGVSKWNGRSSVSDVFAGMEICCWGLNSKVGPFRTVTTEQGYVVAGTYQQYTEAQEKSLINFCLWAKKHNPQFSFDNVVSHDELRREAGRLGDKQDCGGSLSMPTFKLRELLKNEYEKTK
jgi:hypothetical protein